jgi:hypothetical protein
LYVKLEASIADVTSNGCHSLHCAGTLREIQGAAYATPLGSFEFPRGR